MARIDGSVSNRSDSYEYYIEWYEHDIDIANNTSIITATSYIYCKAHSAYNGATYNHTITIDGQEFTTAVAGINLSPGVTKQLATASKTITHNSDGSKSITISASSPNLPYGNGWGPSSGSASGTAVLTTIPRTSSVYCAGGNIGNQTAININRASNDFRHTLTYSFGGASGTIATKTSDTNISWNIPTSFYAQIPNSRSGTGTITCQTYSGDTLVGTSTCQFTANVSNSEPVVNATVIDSNNSTIALTGDNNKIVKYFSNANIITSATAQNSSSITDIRVTCGGKSGNGANVTLNNVESNIFNITVTDSRGFQTSTTITKTLVEYIKCATTSISVERTLTVSDTVVLAIQGNYFNGNFGNSSNTLAISWYYREKGASTWITGGSLSGTITNNTFSYSGQLNNQFNYEKDYEIKVVATDALMTDERLVLLSRGQPIIDIGKNDVNVNGTIKENGISVIKAKTLYSDAIGTTEGVTLSESVSNFNAIEIFYINDAQENSVKIHNPNGKSAMLTNWIYDTSNTFLFIRVNKVTISGTSITRNFVRGCAVNGSEDTFENNYSKFNITKVVGYY